MVTYVTLSWIYWFGNTANSEINRKCLYQLHYVSFWRCLPEFDCQSWKTCSGLYQRAFNTNCTREMSHWERGWHPRWDVVSRLAHRHSGNTWTSMWMTFVVIRISGLVKEWWNSRACTRRRSAFTHNIATATRQFPGPWGRLWTDFVLDSHSIICHRGFDFSEQDTRGWDILFGNLTRSQA